MDAANYYKLNFALVNHYQYGITDLEMLYPFERDIYYQLLIEYLEEVEDKKNTKNVGAGLE